ELIQEELNTNAIVAELRPLLENKKTMANMQADYAELWNLLGSGGASERAAQLIVDDLSKA
ncbi:lipid-A-disaccharide synthase, partial [Bacteroidota bacterium]